MVRRVLGTYPGLMAAGGHRSSGLLAEPGFCAGGRLGDGGRGYPESSLQRLTGDFPDASLQRLTSALQGLNPAEVERRRRLMARTHG